MYNDAGGCANGSTGFGGWLPVDDDDDDGGGWLLGLLARVGEKRNWNLGKLISTHRHTSQNMHP